MELKLAVLVALISLIAAEDSQFNLTQGELTVSSIEVSWAVPDAVTVDKAGIYATRKGGSVKIQALDVPVEDTSYKLTDLLTNVKYNVCLEITYQEGSQPQTTTECLLLKTIALVRPDSVYVLFIVFAVLAGLCVLGCLCWYWDKRKLEKSEEPEEAVESPTENQKTPILHASAPPAYDRPKSSIEDEDIPYITPPLSELEKEKRAQERRAPLATA